MCAVMPKRYTCVSGCYNDAYVAVPMYINCISIVPMHISCRTDTRLKVLVYLNDCSGIPMTCKLIVDITNIYMHKHIDAMACPVQASLPKEFPFPTSNSAILQHNKSITYKLRGQGENHPCMKLNSAMVGWF